MAAGLSFNATDVDIEIPDNSAWDIIPSAGKLTWSLWINPDAGASTAYPQSLITRNGNFKLELWYHSSTHAQVVLTLTGEGTPRKLGLVKFGTKHHIMFSLEGTVTIVGDGTVAADSNVASRLIDADATFYTDGVRTGMIAYNWTDRTFGTLTQIESITVDLDDLGGGTYNVNTTNEQVTYEDHPFTTGDAVTVTGADVPAGLTSGNVYFVNKVDADTIMLYNTAANAITGGATGKVDLTDQGSGSMVLDPKDVCWALSGDTFPDGNEVYFVFPSTWGATLKAFIDGTEAHNEFLAEWTFWAANANKVYVGSTNGSTGWYGGDMNNLAVWLDITFDRRVIDLYNEGAELGLTATEAIFAATTGFWAMDDNAASTAVDEDNGTSAIDGVASANTSTLDVSSIADVSYQEAAGILAFTAATTLTDNLVIRGMVWDGSTTAADDLQVQDGDGNTIWEVNNKIANENAEIWFKCPYVCTNGFKVTTIDAGTLYVYI